MAYADNMFDLSPSSKDLLEKVFEVEKDVADNYSAIADFLADEDVKLVSVQMSVNWGGPLPSAYAGDNDIATVRVIYVPVATTDQAGLSEAVVAQLQELGKALVPGSVATLGLADSSPLVRTTVRTTGIVAAPPSSSSSSSSSSSASSSSSS
jgi:hypothetical protein